jgi:8-oxo-dGTP diphosphatase
VLAARLQSHVLRSGAALLLNEDVDGARQLGAGIGVHLKSPQLAALDARPLPWTQLVGSSCHDDAQLAQAVAIDADFATLSPVAATTSHPQAAALGWSSFQRMVEAAALPVFALGGTVPAQVQLAREHAAQGVAGIGAFW